MQHDLYQWNERKSLSTVNTVITCVCTGSEHASGPRDGRQALVASVWSIPGMVQSVEGPHLIVLITYRPRLGVGIKLTVSELSGWFGWSFHSLNGT